MESLLSFACEHAHSAYWIFFLLLMLAGLNFPISEDIILLTGGAIASMCIPDHAWHLYFWIFAGCWISAWEAYAIGRKLGPRLYDVKWFKHYITRSRIARLHHYYEKFGVFTFIVGRFIPGGVRNALFMSAGLGKMPFLTFISRDGIACFISSSTLFWLGYYFSANYKTIAATIATYNEIAIFAVLIAILVGVIYLAQRRKRSDAA